MFHCVSSRLALCGSPVGGGKGGRRARPPPSRRRRPGPRRAAPGLPRPLQPLPRPQAEMQLLLLVPLLLAPAPGSSVSAALSGPGRPCWGDGCRLESPTPGRGDNPRRGPRARKMGWEEVNPQSELLQKEVGPWGRLTKVPRTAPLARGAVCSCRNGNFLASPPFRRCWVHAHAGVVYPAWKERGNAGTSRRAERGGPYH